MKSVLLHPISTEKCIFMLERENKLVFAVSERANKKEIKEEFEKTFKVKVEKVNTVFTQKGIKKAFIKLSPENLASDIATDLGYI